MPCRFAIAPMQLICAIAASCAATAFSGEAAVKKPSPGNTAYYLDAAKGAGVFRDGKTFFKTLEEWTKATGQETVNGKAVGLTGDPKANLPARLEDLPKDPKDLAKLFYVRLRQGSPCIGSAVPVPENGGRDFWGNALAKKGPKNIGPYEGTPLAPAQGAQGPEGDRGAKPLVLFTEKPSFETQGEGSEDGR